MLNYIWLGLVLAAVLLAGATGQMPRLTDAAFAACQKAVIETAFPLIGFMALWLGIMRLAEKSGLVAVLARALRPIMVRLFPDVPPSHPAMGSMMMNMAANMLGLNNAATPLGLRAMQDLEKLNPRPGLATNAMCTFLAINTSSIQLIPATVVGILVAAKATAPTAIIGTAFVATVCSTIAGITAVKFLERLPAYQLPPAIDPQPAPAAADAPTEIDPPHHPLPLWARLILVAFFIFMGYAAWHIVEHSLFSSTTGADGTRHAARIPGKSPVIAAIEAISTLAIPFLLSFFPLYAALRRVPVYEEFVEGAKEGFQVAIRIIPFLIAILVAVGMFREVGGIQMIANALGPALHATGFPVELLPLVLMRPLSGGGTIGLFRDLVSQVGPDSLIAHMGATIMGSTETTFYVIAVYFGSVAVRRTRHAVPAGLIADLAGVIASIVVCRAFFI
ncbi:MAG: nucleoside recognition domain-containing protein [Terrimicrobiaceae bacterium]|nr:nucleoside recognition domain-containing protein [Terrimicrobiaceae bacterium]